MSWKRNTFASLLLVFGSVVALAGVATAQSSSTNYKVNEYFFGSGGELEACSDQYCSKQSAGELTVGNTSSSSYQANAGFNTSSDPILEVAVNGDVDFGLLSTEHTATGTVNVQVRTYLASGYNMIIRGTAPNYAGEALDAMSAGDEAETGKEQFGINLRNNSAPNIGTDPVQVPDNTFSFGLPTADYNTPNQFKYLNGDTIAYSDSSSGQTNYTLSMIANMAELTDAGRYETKLSIVIVPVF